MKYVQMAKVKYHGPTNTKGSRYQYIIEDGIGVLQRKYFAYDYNINPNEQFKRDLESLGYRALTISEDTKMWYVTIDKIEK